MYSLLTPANHAAQRAWYAPGSPPEAEADPTRWFIPWGITEAVA